jgi:hypothetical protein
MATPHIHVLAYDVITRFNKTSSLHPNLLHPANPGMEHFPQSRSSTVAPSGTAMRHTRNAIFNAYEQAVKKLKRYTSKQALGRIEAFGRDGGITNGQL